VLTSDGSTWISAAAAGGGGDYVMTTFTSPGTWTKPTGLKAVKVTVIGGGGGGGGARNGPDGAYSFNIGTSGAQGGGGGGSIRYLPAPSIPGPVTVTIGAGGTAGPAPGTNFSVTAGGAGGTSSFGAFLTATGGAGAPSDLTNPSPNPGINTTNSLNNRITTGGTGSGGDLNVPGNFGNRVGRLIRYDVALNGDVVANYAGGGALYATPTLRSNVTGNGLSGVGFGSGGTGANILSGSGIPIAGRSGAAGNGGIVIVEEFY